MHQIVIGKYWLNVLDLNLKINCEKIDKYIIENKSNKKKKKKRFFFSSQLHQLFDELTKENEQLQTKNEQCEYLTNIFNVCR